MTEKTITKTIEEKVWVTDDGKEYKSKYDAMKHESWDKTESLPQAEILDEHYTLYYLKTQNDADALIKAFSVGKIRNLSLPCIAYQYYDCAMEENYVEVLTDREIEDITKLFNYYKNGVL
jgi:hypothetical protein